MVSGCFEVISGGFGGIRLGLWQLVDVFWWQYGVWVVSRRFGVVFGRFGLFWGGLGCFHGPYYFALGFI